MPLSAQAGFFSSFMGDQAYADSSGSDSVNNSQNMGLLQANASAASVIQDNKNSKKDSKNSKQPQVDPDQDVKIVSNNALLAAANPIDSSVIGDSSDSSSDQSSIYVVRKGDTINQIADMFDVSVNTILEANDMKKGDKLVEGDVLLILPISGIEHVVVKGETLKSIAKLYKVDVQDITSYNGIAEDAKLTVGDTLMIPGGDSMSDEGGDKPAPNLGSSISKDKNYYDTHPIQNISGYFIDPLPTGHKTQGLHGPGHRGIDIGAPTGTPINASASGVLIAVKTGCKTGRRNCGGGYGNFIIIEHPNGTKTLYGHMSKIAEGMFTGASVTQGQIIGYVGSTGHSTGPHLHFEVFNAKNPGADWSWAQ